MSTCEQQLSSTWSDYYFEKVISSGKFAVILTKFLASSKQYVLKIFPNDEFSHCSYTQENRIHSSLSHPNIIQYMPALFQQSTSEREPDSNYILMEYAPYGDFFNIITNSTIFDEKLIRTYFHHLIQGLKYLHSKNIAHMDLKLENLLLGQDFLLKIADFDLSKIIIDKPVAIYLGGTENYRSPQVLSGGCTNYCAADIYSAGICLYTLLTGAFPFIEERNEYGDIQLFRYDLFEHDNDRFWKENEDLLSDKLQFSQNFKDLINRMFAKSPPERITLEEILKSNWYNEPIYTPEELKTEIKIFLSLKSKSF